MHAVSDIATAGARLLGQTLIDARALAGGDLADIVHIRLADGRDAVVKTGPAPRTEARMLEALAAADVPVPAVLAVDDSVLVLETMPGDGRLEDAWGSVGAVLKRAHAAIGQRYGWPESYAFGDVVIDNTWSDDWPDFWAERRLLVHADFVPAVLARRIARLAGELSSRLPATPSASLLHGDLWSGNVMTDGGRVSAFIDPACYYGDGEVDIAMLTLFGGPGPELFDAYGALEPGHERRRPIYQLWPALVHCRLFGSGYHPMADRLLSACGV